MSDDKVTEIIVYYGGLGHRTGYLVSIKKDGEEKHVAVLNSVYEAQGFYMGYMRGSGDHSAKLTVTDGAWEAHEYEYGPQSGVTIGGGDE